MISIRSVQEADLDSFFEHQADPLGIAMALVPARDRDALIEHWHRNLAREDTVARTVIVDATVAGHVVSWESDGRRWVGYWIGREFWGRGVATEALRALLSEVAQRPLFAQVAVSNVGSSRVLEKNGFERASEHPQTGDDGVEEWLFRLD